MWFGYLRVWALACLLLVVSGMVYRFLAHHLNLVVDTPISLPVSLSTFPTRIGEWSGRDVPIPEYIKGVAGNDDSINRLYVNSSNNEWINVYIAYTARPRTMLGHRPEICYVAGGWIHDYKEQVDITYGASKKVPCLLHRFHVPTPRYEERIVLNFYIVNGQITTDESVFSTPWWRTPNIAGNPARYVAQVQISSVLESSIRTAAGEMVEPILDLLPDKNGLVRAAVSEEGAKDVLK